MSLLIISVAIYIFLSLSCGACTISTKMQNQMSEYVVIAITMTSFDLLKWKHCYLDCKNPVFETYFLKARVKGIKQHNELRPSQERFHLDTFMKITAINWNTVWGLNNHVSFCLKHKSLVFTKVKVPHLQDVVSLRMS